MAAINGLLGRGFLKFIGSGWLETEIVDQGILLPSYMGSNEPTLLSKDTTRRRGRTS
jgi:hypothetical protein